MQRKTAAKSFGYAAVLYKFPVIECFALKVSVLVMHDHGDSFFRFLVKLAHAARRHIDASMAAIANPDIAAEGAAPVGVVEAFSRPVDAEPVFDWASVLRTIRIISPQHDVPGFV